MSGSKLTTIATIIGAIFSVTLFIYALFHFQARPVPHTAKFTSGACFIHNGVLEPWEELPDGIVILRGSEKYLVMFKDQAERRTFGTKYGTSLEILTLDNNYHEVLCPLVWRFHGRIK